MTNSGSARSFEAWRQLAYSPLELADPSTSGPYAMPQGSDLSNISRFYFGFPPVVAAGDSSVHRANLPNVQTRTIENIPHVSLVFTRVAAATDVVTSIERSFDLTTWSPYVPLSTVIGPTTGSLETVEVPLTADSVKSFYRVKLNLVTP